MSRGADPMPASYRRWSTLIAIVGSIAVVAIVVVPIVVLLARG